MTTQQNPANVPQDERTRAIDVASKYYGHFKTGYTTIVNGLGSIESAIDDTFSTYVKAPINHLFGRQESSQEEEKEVYEEPMKSSQASMGKTLSPQHQLVKPGKEKTIAYWLLGIAALVYLMISLGAYTRLVKLGHSVTGMHPIGWKGQVESMKKYIEQYIWRKQAGFLNMTFLDEYLSTLIEKSIGVLFLIPFGYFTLKGFIMPKLRNRLLGLIAMQILQGFMGTWLLNMEHKMKAAGQNKSGKHLVSTYRMFVHWNTTMFMFAVLVWNGITLFRNPGKSVTRENVREHSSLRNLMTFVFGINVLNFITGVMVAGIDGSRHYNTFPLMDGRVIPSGYLSGDSFFKDLFENIATVQFNHRLFAIVSYALVTAVFIISRKRNLSSEAKRAFTILFILTNLQIVGGILVLMAKGHWISGFLHQSNAIWVLGASMFGLHVLRKPNPAQVQIEEDSAKVLQHAKTD